MTKQTRNALDIHRSSILSDTTLREISCALPQGLADIVTPERFAKIALSTVGRNKALWECSPESLVRSIVTAAEFGLELTGGPLSNAYLVPYKSDCQLIISWPGLVLLARRGGQVVDVKGMVIYEADDFVYEEGLSAKFVHRPNLKTRERGDIIASYCVTSYASGVKTVNVMHSEDIERRRAVSPSGNFRDGPWGKWYDQMAIKSVIKLAAKTWPKTPELAKALLREDEDEGFVAPDIYESVLEKEKKASPILRPVPDLQAVGEHVADMDGSFASLLRLLNAAKTPEALQAAKATCRRFRDGLSESERARVNALCAKRSEAFKAKAAGGNGKAMLEDTLREENAPADNAPVEDIQSDDEQVPY